MLCCAVLVNTTPLFLSLTPCCVLAVFHWNWYLGAVMCKLYLAEDFTMCAMSTMVIVLFAWDRLAVITLGASYSVCVCVCVSVYITCINGVCLRIRFYAV